LPVSTKKKPTFLLKKHIRNPRKKNKKQTKHLQSPFFSFSFSFALNNKIKNKVNKNTKT
jgi:hypothetical protein